MHEARRLTLWHRLGDAERATALAEFGDALRRPRPCLRSIPSLATMGAVACTDYPTAASPTDGRRMVTATSNTGHVFVGFSEGTQLRWERRAAVVVSMRVVCGGRR